MKREIKFRGKSIDTNDWVYGLITRQFRKASSMPLLTAITSFVFGVGEVQVDTETVGQFTGLKDMNNKEIYEGDIVDVTLIFADGDTAIIRGLIVYHEAGFFVKIDNAGYDDYWALNPIKKPKVIGNIYDNPELTVVLE